MFDPVSLGAGGLGGLIQGISSLFNNQDEEKKQKESAKLEMMKTLWSPWLGQSLQPKGVYQAQKSSVLGDAIGGFTDLYDQSQRLSGGKATEKAEKALTFAEEPQAHQLEFMNEDPEMVSSEAWDAVRKQRNPWLAQLGGGRSWG